MVKDMEIQEFTQQLASSQPVPGGGGSSALAGALGAALGQMVANLTIGKKRYAEVEEEIQKVCRELSSLQEEMLHLADRDEEVFAPLAKAYALPKNTPEEQAAKEAVMEERLLDAALVPLEVMEKAFHMLDLIEILEEKGSRMAVSDAGVSVQFVRTAVLGAAMNVYINTKSMKNREKAMELNQKADQLTAAASQKADWIYSQVLQQLR